jgi:hypothetical protein
VVVTLSKAVEHARGCVATKIGLEDMVDYGFKGIAAILQVKSTMYTYVEAQWKCEKAYDDTRPGVMMIRDQRWFCTFPGGPLHLAIY